MTTRTATRSRPGDPTAVMGRRTAAWVLDAFVYVALMSGIFLGSATSVPAAVTGCEVLREAGVTDTCVEVGGEALFLEDGASRALLPGAAVAWFLLVYVLLQGFAGASPGKLLTGIRVIRPDGRICGPGRSAARSLLWAIDAAPWVVPGVVALVTGLTTTGHRRVGDMVADTYVVGRSSVGTPIVVGGPDGIPNHPPRRQ